MNIEEERDALRRELIGVQEMLAFVLLEVGEPVEVLKDTISKGIPANIQISVDDNQDRFTFSLVEVE